MKRIWKMLCTAAMIAATNVVFLCALLPSAGQRACAYALAGVLLLLLNLFPPAEGESARLRVLSGGVTLLRQFLIVCAVDLAGAVLIWLYCVPDVLSGARFAAHAAVAACALFLIFWNGIIRLYCTSVQLGLRLRVAGALAGWIPVVNLFVLGKLIAAAAEECRFENNTVRRDRARAKDAVCRTRYPLLLVHGVFFRDSRALNYWGRIPAALERNGAVVFYGSQQSAASVADSAAELVRRIETLVREHGCEKVNVIAHSKGGLDMRYALSHLSCGQYVASLTTINTPHRGCLFAEYLLKKAPDGFLNSVASAYNSALRRLGDQKPDFLSAVRDLTNESCQARNADTPDVPGVYYQSVGSWVRGAAGGKFPLNISYPLVLHFDGANDGLVSVESAKWGERFTCVAPSGRRGVTHADMIDLNRENITGFDVREFYVGLVRDLKQRGL